MEILKLKVAALPELVYWAPSYKEKNQQIWSEMAKDGGPKS